MSAQHDDGVAARMAMLSKMKINELRATYTRTTGKPANRLGRDALIKTLASAPAQAPATGKRPRAAKAKQGDPRLPAPGGTIERVFKGRTIRVEVTPDGLRCEGKGWSSLTALALHLTGYKAVSGPAFFGLTKPATPKGTKE